MEVKSETLYSVLGIEKTATKGEISKAYKKLALKYHSDKNAGSNEFTEIFYKIKEAYEVLGNPEKRASYDQSIDSKSSSFFKSRTDNQTKPTCQRQTEPTKPKTVPSNGDLDKLVDDLCKEAELELKQEELLRVKKREETLRRNFNSIEIKKQVFELCNRLHVLNKEIYSLITKFHSTNYSEIVRLFNRFCEERSEVNNHSYFSCFCSDVLYQANIERNKILYKSLLERAPESIRAQHEASELNEGIKLRLMYKLQSFITELQIDLLIDDKQLLKADCDRFNQWLGGLLTDERSHFLYLQRISREFMELLRINRIILFDKNPHDSIYTSPIHGQQK